MTMIKKTSVLLIMCVVGFALCAGPAFAQSTKINGNAWFTGDEIESDFSSEEIADAITDLQPGDDVSIKISYRNDYDEKTYWYMANEVIQTLEKADSARKVPEGTGTPENGGYTYSLIHTDKKGKQTVLFSNEKVGGEAKPGGMEGLEQATNALDEWFYIQTLNKGEKGSLDLKIKFDGETEVNDYMDTDGGVMFRFAVDLADKTTKSPKYHQTRTGDTFPLWWVFILMMLAGAVMLVILLRQRKNREGGEA